MAVREASLKCSPFALGSTQSVESGGQNDLRSAGTLRRIIEALLGLLGLTGLYYHPAMVAICLTASETESIHVCAPVRNMILYLETGHQFSEGVLFPTLLLIPPANKALDA